MVLVRPGQCDGQWHAGAGIVSVEMVAFEWLRSCEHAGFKRVLKRLEEPFGG